MMAAEGIPTVVSIETRGTMLRVNVPVANIIIGRFILRLLLNIGPKKLTFIILVSFKKYVPC